MVRRKFQLGITTNAGSSSADKPLRNRRALEEIFLNRGEPCGCTIKPGAGNTPGTSCPNNDDKCGNSVYYTSYKGRDDSDNGGNEEWSSGATPRSSGWAKLDRRGKREGRGKRDGRSPARDGRSLDDGLSSRGAGWAEGDDGGEGRDEGGAQVVAVVVAQVRSPLCRTPWLPRSLARPFSRPGSSFPSPEGNE